MHRALPLVFALGVLSPTYADSRESLTLTEAEQGVLDATNAERRRAGLSELKPNPQLFEAARRHAGNMARKGRLDHNLDGHNFADRIRATGYPLGAGGENIAWNQRTARDVVQSWMNSAGHRRNLLNGRYSEIGIAAAVNARGEPYWVQVFANPGR